MNLASEWVWRAFNSNDHRSRKRSPFRDLWSRLHWQSRISVRVMVQVFIDFLNFGFSQIPWALIIFPGQKVAFESRTISVKKVTLIRFFVAAWLNNKPNILWINNYGLTMPQSLGETSHWQCAITTGNNSDQILTVTSIWYDTYILYRYVTLASKYSISGCFIVSLVTDFHQSWKLKNCLIKESKRSILRMFIS